MNSVAAPIRVAVLACLLLALGLPGAASGLQIHQQIQGPFASAREVTVKCLECHRQQGEDILRSSHWTWVRQRTVNGKNVQAGKKDSLAGFAIDVATNGPRCLRCHISISPQKEIFDRPAAELVDCLACHDTTGLYRHAASPSQGEAPDLVGVARAVGRPTPRNCTGCHFADCGLAPKTEKGRGGSGLADVHLRATGPAFTCQTCHLSGSGHAISRQMKGGEGCASCHTAPHALELLNQHSRTISCQACHIPAYAKDAPVLIAWNWLMTGKTNTVFRAGSGAGRQLHDQNGFWSASDIEPVYRWDDTTDQAYTRGQKIQPQELTVLQQPAEKSASSRLAPFRVLYGTQLYDSKYRYLISPQLQAEGEVLFPAGDWETIARKGMEAMVLPFSGQYGLAATATYRRINHGVAPAAQALDCLDCHGTAGRMQWKMLGFEKDPMLTPPASAPAAPAPPQPQPVQQPPPAAAMPQVAAPVTAAPQPSPPSPAGSVLPPAQEPAVPVGTGR